MRVALVRGSLLRPWEPPNYAIEGVEVTAFVSADAARRLAPSGLPLRVLRSPAVLLEPLGPRARGMIDLVLGSTERLLGLERALDGYDVAHVLELANPFSLQAVRAREAGACRAVVATVMENVPFPYTANRVVAERARETAAKVDHFIAITERARVHLQVAGVEDDRITVLPLGTDVHRFSPAPERHGVAPDGPLRIACVSRLEVGKGVEDLAIAVGLLARRGVSAAVTYIGDGPSRPAIERIANEMGVPDRVRFSGPVAWERLHETHHGHDVFVLASAPTRNWREQFGFAVIEAMASGLPVLVGDSGSLMEVVGNPESLVSPHDPVSLADRLAELAGDQDLRRRLGEGNRARAVEHFDQRRIGARLAEIYRRVTSGV